jgi:hypothetical protein
MNLRHDPFLRQPALLLWVVLALGVSLSPARDYADTIAPLLDPAKLATLGERGANPRVQKCVYWLEMARKDRQKPGQVIDEALRNAHYGKAAAGLTREALLRNLEIAGKHGCLDASGLETMKRGQAPTIQRGRYKGRELSVDHFIPRDICPELDCVIANLQYLPLPLNEAKTDKIGPPQVKLAKALHAAGLLDKHGLSRVLEADAKRKQGR